MSLQLATNVLELLHKLVLQYAETVDEFHPKVAMMALLMEEDARVIAQLRMLVLLALEALQPQLMFVSQSLQEFVETGKRFQKDVMTEILEAGMVVLTFA